LGRVDRQDFALNRDPVGRDAPDAARADQIISASAEKAASAPPAFAASQERTKLVIMGIGVAIVGIGLLLKLVHRPRHHPAAAQARGRDGSLATGDTRLIFRQPTRATRWARWRAP